MGRFFKILGISLLERLIWNISGQFVQQFIIIIVMLLFGANSFSFYCHILLGAAYRLGIFVLLCRTFGIKFNLRKGASKDDTKDDTEDASPETKFKAKVLQEETALTALKNKLSAPSRAMLRYLQEECASFSMYMRQASLEGFIQKNHLSEQEAAYLREAFKHQEARWEAQHELEQERDLYDLQPPQRIKIKRLSSWQEIKKRAQASFKKSPDTDREEEEAAALSEAVARAERELKELRQS